MSQEKVALVTGVSSGIGRAIAGLLSRHGFRVFGTARGNGGAKRALENVELVHVDVCDEESVHSCVRTVLDRADESTPWSTTRGTPLLARSKRRLPRKRSGCLKLTFSEFCE